MKLKKISLNELSKMELNERAMCRILGGAGNCQCSCAYAGNGGSSTSANGSANNKGDLYSDPSLRPQPVEPTTPTTPPIDPHLMCYSHDTPCNHSAWGCPKI